MELGFSTMNNLHDPAPGDLARALEDRGFDSLWLGEHAHIPAVRHTPYPAGGDMPELYKHMMDPFLSLTAAATATERLVVGTGVALPLERDLLTLANTVATLDHLSAGRFVFGVGVGWNEEELADHRPDIPWSKRYAALAEMIAALRVLWTEEEASFGGEWFAFDRAWSFPKPRQRPYPPVYFGTNGPVGVRHTVAWADGWTPVGVDRAAMERTVERFRALGAEAGRDEIPITVAVFGDPNPDTLRHYAELGIERAVIGANRTGWDDPATILPFLDRHTPLVPELRGAANP
ncbi:MAG: LLM class F420-dependent oxidoreductase [Acidimicrobiales bacterium]|nr:LLM class F420-dependent oxidoreductase [Acidimicrobiales bacterium]